MKSTSTLKSVINGFVLIAFMITTSYAFGQKKPDKALQKQLEKIKEKTEELRTKLKVPGVGLAIIKDGKVVLSEGFGYRDVENQLPVDAQTTFAIGSASKAFATASMAVLVDEGSIAWDDKVKKHLPDFKLKDAVATEEMTLLDLMTHRSGLPRHDFSWIGSPLDRESLYQRMKFLDFNQTFRGAWQYQNLMYTTGGYLAGKVAGKPWEALVQEKILDPLDMTSTVLSHNEFISMENLAHPYVKKGEEVVKIPHERYDAIGPAGGVNSTITDMAKWVRMHLGDTTLQGHDIISVGQKATMHAPLTTVSASRRFKELTHRSYGLGWFVYYNRGHAVVEHGGNVSGFSALVYMLPDDNIGMVILTNMNSTTLPATLALYSTDILLSNDEVNWYERIHGKEKTEEEKEKEKDLSAEPERVEGTKTSQPMAAYTGTFENPGYGELTVEALDDSLVARYNGATMGMEHWHYDVFRGHDSFYELKRFMNYRTGNDGAITQLEVSFEPTVDPILFTKKPPNQMADPEFLAKLVGTYNIQGAQKATVEFKDKLHLQVVVPGQPPYELVPLKENEFQLKPLKGFSVKFKFDQDGNVTGMDFIQPNGTFPAVREN